MKAVRLDQLIPSVTDKLPATPLKGQVIRAIREAAQRFCFETEVWKQPLAAIDIVANQLTYTLAAEWQAEIRRIHSVFIKTDADVAAGRLGKERDCSGDTFTPATSEYRFKSSPSSIAVTDGLVITVVQVPNLQTDEMPEWITGLYGNAFVYGAIADLCTHKGAGPMYDADTAKLYNQKYEKIKNAAASEVFRSHMNASPSINPLYNLSGAFSGTGYRVGG
ncbi:MAG: hypothetical protein WCS52_01945 [bacterium]